VRFLSSELVELFVNNRQSLNGPASGPLETCPACGSGRLRFLFRKLFFAHRRCAECGYVFVDPRPAEEELLAMYGRIEYFRRRTEFFELARIREERSFDITLDVEEWYRTIATRISELVPEGELLDIGGGSGRFLKFVADRFPEFRTTLAEIDPELCRVASDSFGIEAFNGTVEQLAAGGRTFDAVVSIATLEHVFDPISYLTAVRSVMNPDAVLYLTMPRLGPLTRTFTTSAAYDVMPPVHLNFFDRKSLDAAIRTHELRLAIVGDYQSHGPVFHLGHVLCKENYIVEDVIMEPGDDVPMRVHPHRDDSRLTHIVCGVLDRLNDALSPVIAPVDGQRVAHFVLRAT
jgi:2-polyprenyl-3-methyl-5-hydroxy-6-metoxy-1,4-benzoquinol methylase